MPKIFSNWFELTAGALLVGGALLLNYYFMGPAITVLNIGLMISFLIWALTIRRQNFNYSKLGYLFSLAVFVQGFHFLEEYLTGFYTEFPQFFGYSWSPRLFIVFNLIWLFLFALAAVGVFYRVRLAFLLVWFFTLIAGIGNGLGHPAMSLLKGGYFPGLFTSFILLVIGIILIKELVRSVSSQP